MRREQITKTREGTATLAQDFILLQHHLSSPTKLARMPRAREMSPEPNHPRRFLTEKSSTRPLFSWEMARNHAKIERSRCGMD